MDNSLANLTIAWPKKMYPMNRNPNNRNWVANTEYYLQINKYTTGELVCVKNKQKNMCNLCYQAK